MIVYEKFLTGRFSYSDWEQIGQMVTGRKRGKRFSPPCFLRVFNFFSQWQFANPCARGGEKRI